MNKSLVFTALAAALMVAAPAFAQSTSPAKSSTAEASGHINASEKVDMANCKALIGQVDVAIANHATSPNLSLAKKQRQAGENACFDGSYGEGQAMLKSALKDLGA